MLKVRARDKQASLLREMARQGNFIWNYLNALCQRSMKERGAFLSAFDMRPYTKGAGKYLGLHSHAVQCVAAEAEARPSRGQEALGIDLGLKTVATCRDVSVLDNARFYRDLEPALGAAQRAGKKARAQAIHANIANYRKDALHPFGCALVERCGLIVVGDVSPQHLTQTPMAKSVLAAGWGQLNTMLAYQYPHAGIVYKEAREAYATQTCSGCGALPDSRPDNAGPGIREGICSGCGVIYDRDVNATRNILARGHGRPDVGIPAHLAQGGCQS